MMKARPTFRFRPWNIAAFTNSAARLFGCLLFSCLASCTFADDFFESRIRPVLVEQCYECHNSADVREGGLSVDFRGALLKGGDNGPAINVEDPIKSLLLAVMKHEVEGLEMPQGGDKLSDEILADFETWLRDGAKDPRDAPPDADAIAEATSWEATFEKRAGWWSFQPLREASPPDKSADPDQSADHHASNAIDAFIQQKLNEARLTPNPPAEPHVLVRRLYLVLTGLPPSAEDAKKWSERLATGDQSQRNVAYESLVDELLDGGFAKRWARHWMDWVRYADSHGSEGDPLNPGAFEYRDYLVRALQADIPYDQLLREHIAGDLLKHPRMRPDTGTNESVIGAAHWRMVFHGFAPTDAKEERVRFTDDQINTFSKAFLGLTVSCARCHDHKFDPISQSDYYAIFGTLASGRPGRLVIDDPAAVQPDLEKLTGLKQKIRSSLASTWEQLDLAAIKPSLNRIADLDAKATSGFERKIQLLLQAYRQGTSAEEAWHTNQRRESERVAKWRELETNRNARKFELTKEDEVDQWYRYGAGLSGGPVGDGAFALFAQGDSAVRGIYPAGMYSHLITDLSPARLTSPDIQLDDEYQLWVLARGEGGSTLRYVVQDYPRDGTVYPVSTLGNNWNWHRYDLSYWKGDQIHIEIAAAADAPLRAKNNPRSWFGIQEAWLVPKSVAFPGERDRAWEAVSSLAGGAYSNH